MNHLERAAAIHEAVVKHGIPWMTWLGWVFKYGLPLVEQVFAQLTGLNLSGMTLTQIIQFIEAALAAGGALPPLPA
jgi:hypothetical protein